MIRNTKDKMRKAEAGILTGAIAAFVLIVLFSFLATTVSINKIERFDTAVGDPIHTLRADWLTPIMEMFTFLGSSKAEITVTMIAITIVALRLKYRAEALIIVINLVGVWQFNELLKKIFHRTRPALEHLVNVTGYSFPSGHAMVSTGCYGLLGYIVIVHLQQQGKSTFAAYVATALLIGLIGFSRVYLGVHYPSDVLAGFAIGGAWLIGCCYAIRTMRKRRLSQIQ